MKLHLSLLVAGLSLLPAFAHADLRVWREQSQATVSAAGLRAVRVENARGLIRVAASADGQLHLTALKVTRSSDPARAAEFARQTLVETHRTGDRYLVRVVYPQRQTVRISFWRLFQKDGFDLPTTEVRLALEMPAALQLALDTSSGDIETTGLAGFQALETTSGDITVRDARGPLAVGSTSGDVDAQSIARGQVHTVSGDVSVNTASGPLQVHTTSGEIEVRAAADSLALATVSADIRCDAAPRGLVASSTSGSITVEKQAAGVVRINSTSGDVELGLQPGLRKADIHTLSGDVSLRLSPGMGCALDLSTRSGGLDSAVPVQVRTVSRHTLAGVIGGGGPPVTVRSTSGGIDVTREAK